MRKKRIDAILEWLKEPLKMGISVTVVTRPAESYKEPKSILECIELLQSKVSVITNSNTYQKFILIDNRLVWYGNINLLSYNSSEEGIMRLESRELAAELDAIIHN